MMKKLGMNLKFQLPTGFLLLFALLVLEGRPLHLTRQSLDESHQESVGGEIQHLLLVLRDEQLQQTDPERVIVAIERVGELGAVAAINDLIRLITFRRTFWWEKEDQGLRSPFRAISPAGRYPAVGALFQIGQPSLPALIELIATHETGSLESENALDAVTGIFREEREKGVKFLQEGAAKAASTEAAQRLWLAAEKAANQVERLKSIEQREQQTRDQEVNQLLLILRDEPLRKADPKRVFEAINQLGQMQVAAAIEDLIRLIAFQRTYSEREGDPILSQIRPTSISVRYPATEALFRIGEPALQALAQVIESSDSRTVESENALYTVKLIFRQRPGVAVEFLTEAMGKAASAEAAQRLRPAAEEVAEEIEQFKRIQEQDYQSSGEEVHQLLAMVRDYELREKDPNQVIQAINRLGELQAVAAIDDLIRLITYSQTYENGKQDPLRSQLHPAEISVEYPATAALFRIGEPALPALAQVIESYDRWTINRENALYTVRMVFRQKPGGAAAFLRNAAQSALTLEGVHRLWQAAEKAAEKGQEAKEQR